ncbi:MAG: hypothetical protein GY777_01855 [Candidatus Brocadiaceae bacterium]|nr:hypothetical protein [Candidatus Brocadiaceae bacterium]
MDKLLMFIALLFTLNCNAQYKKKHRKTKTQMSEKICLISSGVIFASAGVISMKTRGDKPFNNNGTKWLMSPSEWAIVQGVTLISFGVVYKF